MNASVAFNSADSRDKVRCATTVVSPLLTWPELPLLIGSPGGKRREEAHPALHQARRGRVVWCSSRRVGVHLCPVPRAPARHPSTPRRLPPYPTSAGHASITSGSVWHPVGTEGRAEGLRGHARRVGTEVPGDVREARCRQGRDDRRGHCRPGGGEMDAGPAQCRERESSSDTSSHTY